MIKKILFTMLSALALSVCATVSASGFSSVALAQGLDVVIRFGPPEPRIEYRPQARNGYTWADGHWELRGRRHTWVKGYWLRNQRGYDYEQSRWEQRGNQWVMHRGKWKAQSGKRNKYNERDDRRNRNQHRRQEH